MAWGPHGDDTYAADLWFADGFRARLDAFDGEAVAVVAAANATFDAMRIWLTGA